MVEYTPIKITSTLVKDIDALIQKGLYSSRPEYVKELIRNDMKQRGTKT